MTQLFIFGNSGSGKSTLARRLALQRNVLHLDLDRFAWTATIGERRELKDSLAAIQAELGEQPAVIEGMYSDLVEQLISPQDELIWLDLPLEDCIAHCKARPFEAHKWESAEAQNAFLPRLLEFLPDYYEVDTSIGRRAHEAVFAAFGGKKRRITSPQEADLIA